MKDLYKFIFAVVIGALVFVATISYIFLNAEVSERPKTPKFITSFGEGNFNNPVSIAYVPEHETIYVSDPEKGIIAGFDTEGRLKKAIRKRRYGEKGFLTPGYICAYSGNLLVSDPYQRQLYIYNIKGECESEFVEAIMPADFYPGPVAGFRDGKLAVADNQKGILYIFNPDGKPKEEYGTYSKRLFIRAASVDVCGDRVLVLDNGKERVIEVNPFGKVAELTLEGRIQGSEFLVGLTRDGNTIYVADALSSVIRCYSNEGLLKGEFGNVTDSRKKLFLPVGVEIVGNRFFILEKGNKRISVWEKR